MIVYSYDEDPYIKSGYVFYIKNKNSGKYLDVQNAKDSIGTNVGQYPFNGTNAQKWKVVYAGDFYYLKTVCSSSGLMLNIYTADGMQGANVDINAINSTGSMKFRIFQNSDKFSYRIMSASSNYTKAVTIQNASCSTGANAFQWQYNGSTNDEWIFEPADHYSRDLGINYATQNYNKRVNTYPNLNGLGGDCTNFVSQCMLASGKSFKKRVVYK